MAPTTATVGAEQVTAELSLLGSGRTARARVAGLGLAVGELLDGLSAGEVDPAAVVDLDDLDHDLVPHRHHVLDLLDPVLGEVADADQPLLLGRDLDEGTEAHQARDLPLVDAADLDLVGQVADHVQGLLAGLRVGARDEHPAVVLDVDRGTRLLDDPADGLAAWADDLADLVGVDLDGVDAGRPRAHLGPRLRQRLGHLAEDVQPAHPGLLEGALQELPLEAADLDVHLQGGDPPGRSGDLEVHVAEGVLHPLDVAEDRRLRTLLVADQAHGDARHRGLQRHAGVHQREGRAADRGHRGRAVAAQDLGDDPHHVGERLLVGHDVVHRPLGERAVADLATARGAQRPRLPHRERREVVVVHVALELLESRARPASAGPGRSRGSRPTAPGSGRG